MVQIHDIQIFSEHLISSLMVSKQRVQRKKNNPRKTPDGKLKIINNLVSRKTNIDPIGSI
jgi:hypothetical protein